MSELLKVRTGFTNGNLEGSSDGLETGDQLFKVDSASHQITEIGFPPGKRTRRDLSVRHDLFNSDIVELGVQP